MKYYTTCYRQVDELRHGEDKPAESSSNNLDKEHSPGQENRPASHNVMMRPPPPLPAAKPKHDASKLDAAQAAALLRSCRLEMQQGRQEIQRQVKPVTLMVVRGQQSVGFPMEK